MTEGRKTVRGRGLRRSQEGGKDGNFSFFAIERPYNYSFKWFNLLSEWV